MLWNDVAIFFDARTSLISVLLLAGILNQIRMIRRERRLKARFQLLLDSVPCTISWISNEKVYVEANQQLSEMLDIPRKDFVGQKVGFHGMEPGYMKFVDAIFTHEKDRTSHEFSIDTPQGEKHIFSIAQKYNNGEEAAIIGIDVTQLKEKERIILEQEQTLIQREKLSNLGQMAGSMGHEINNPVTVILLSVYDLKEMVESGKVDLAHFKTNLDRIEKTGVRIAKIVKGLKAVSREGSGDPFDTIAFNMILDDTMTLCQQRLTNYGVELRLPANAQEFFMWGQSTQITQVLLNLINNAADAVNELPADAPRWVEIKLEEDANVSRICVMDSGGGPPPEFLKKIFEPFFTTKAVGKGTGLGLSISRTILDRHGGKLSYDNSRGCSCFVIEIPRQPQKLAG